jgi:hypothetical protein
LFRVLALAAFAFFAVRTAATTVSFASYHRSFTGELTALDHIPAGARVVRAGRQRRAARRGRRLGWITCPAMAIVRATPSSTINGRSPARSCSAFVRPDPRFAATRRSSWCPTAAGIPEWRDVDDALRLVPRGAFDYVWLLDPPPYDRAQSIGTSPLWRRGTSISSASNDRIATSDTPNGSGHAPDEVPLEPECPGKDPLSIGDGMASLPSSLDKLARDARGGRDGE